jgi:ribosomal protein S18 acetylase RimI-like enzyme
VNRPLVRGRNLEHLLIEPAREHDEAYVYDSWLEGYRHSPRTCKWPVEAYRAFQRAAIDRLLKRSTLVVARPHDWPEGVVGWLCCEQTPDAFILHWASVKPAFRRQGVLAMLLASQTPQGALLYSHLRPPFTDTLNRRGFAWDKAKAR